MAWCLVWWTCSKGDQDLYSIAEGKDGSVSSLIGFSGEDRSHCWNLRFICNCYDWELEELDFLMDVILTLTCLEVMIVWDGFWVAMVKFSLWSYYDYLGGSSSTCFPWKSIHSNKTPNQVPFFMWTATLGKITTIRQS